MPVTKPFSSERNFTPTSTAPVSPESTIAGELARLKTEQGQLPGGAGCVVKYHNTPELKEFPDVSFTPVAPPVTMTVYRLANSKPYVGDRVAVNESLP